MKEIVVKSSSQLQNVISKLEQYNKNFESKVQEMVAEQKELTECGMARQIRNLTTTLTRTRNSLTRFIRR